MWHIPSQKTVQDIEKCATDQNPCKNYNDEELKKLSNFVKKKKRKRGGKGKP